MPDVRPFRAWRYDLGRVGALSDVVAPPYDVIDPPLQDALYEKHPNNVIRLILNKAEAGDNDRQNRYTRAARFLKDWQRDGVLRKEAGPALYVYHQTFQLESGSYTRRGVLARVRLEPFGEGRIFPHEETMPGPKADRLNLMRATGMNLSPVFGLYPDPAPSPSPLPRGGEGRVRGIQDRLDAAVQRVLPLEAVDHLGTVSRLWPITSPELIREVQRLFFEKPIFIADGHHRYETSLKYRDELRTGGEVRDDEAAANFVLMMLVSMSDPGLLILPTHRLVSGLPQLTAERLRSILAEHFDVQTVGKGAAAAREAWERIEVSGEQGLLAFGTTLDDTWQIARFLAPEVMTALAGEHSPSWRGLGVSILHVLVLNKLIREGLAVEPTCDYVHLLDEVIQAMAAGRSRQAPVRITCQLVVLVPPAGMEHVEQIAGNLEKMPPKSTYFFPKLLSGLVFNPLKGA